MIYETFCLHEKPRAIYISLLMEVVVADSVEDGSGEACQGKDI